MSLNDPMAAILSKINNAEKVGKKEIITEFNSKIIRKVLELLNLHNFTGSYEEVDSSFGKSLKINLLGNINKTGVIKPNYSVKLEDFEKFEKRFLPAKDFGIIIVSTSKGIMTHTDAKNMKIGGKLLAYCY